MKVLAILLLAALETPAAPSPERVDVERCVWDSVRLLTGAAPRAGIDAQLKVANTAVDQCRQSIRRWAEASPAVRTAGDPVRDVEQAMTNFYIARAAQFAAGEARPFFLTDANDRNR